VREGVLGKVINGIDDRGSSRGREAQGRAAPPRGNKGTELCRRTRRGEKRARSMGLTLVKLTHVCNLGGSRLVFRSSVLGIARPGLPRTIGVTIGLHHRAPTAYSCAGTAALLVFWLRAFRYCLDDPGRRHRGHVEPAPKPLNFDVGESGVPGLGRVARGSRNQGPPENRRSQTPQKPQHMPGGRAPAIQLRRRIVRATGPRPRH
jgi:hypothetical protein